jgi:hypothetical protein
MREAGYTTGWSVKMFVSTARRYRTVRSAPVSRS